MVSSRPPPATPPRRTPRPPPSDRSPNHQPPLPCRPLASQTNQPSTPLLVLPHYQRTVIISDPNTHLLTKPCAGHVLIIYPHSVLPATHRPDLTILWDQGAVYCPHFPPLPKPDVLAAAHTCFLAFTHHCDRQHGLDCGSLAPWAATSINHFTATVTAHSTTFKFPGPLLSPATLAAFKTRNLLVTVRTSPPLSYSSCAASIINGFRHSGGPPSSPTSCSPDSNSSSSNEASTLAFP